MHIILHFINIPSQATAALKNGICLLFLQVFAQGYSLIRLAEIEMGVCIPDHLTIKRGCVACFRGHYFLLASLRGPTASASPDIKGIATASFTSLNCSYTCSLSYMKIYSWINFTGYSAHIISMWDIKMLCLKVARIAACALLDRVDKHFCSTLKIPSCTADGVP